MQDALMKKMVTLLLIQYKFNFNCFLFLIVCIACSLNEMFYEIKTLQLDESLMVLPLREKLNCKD
jgi:hypothetical protein